MSRRPANRRHRLGAVATAALTTGFVLLTLGGCTVGTEQREPATTKVKEVVDARRGHFDLSRPPSREEAGMPAGRTDVVYQRSDHEPIAVTVTLPERGDLLVDARLLTFDALSQPNPTTAAPNSLDIHYYAPSLDAGRDHLTATAQRFGLDEALVRKWYEEAREAQDAQRPSQAPPTVSAPWLRAKVGYLNLEVQAQYSAAADDSPGPGQTLVHYLLTWQSSPPA